ncbi:HNH endonuclease [Rhodococcus sp. ABRD24]|uniref:HNH endonuclease signature motif containing protein n=1 Tax=Rhodococcus sp. ABRD24 TaxID=2507582 RepID=UPI00103AC905|nr:HNH endonuclease signature motif containing protein [Rhodococcus sp. ABRD24]QBJ97859.1 HNH endonuclease [Rhodococcus sp. ABRD24]
MFDRGILAGAADSDLSEVLIEHHARIAREEFREVEAVTTVYVTRCGEDARAGIGEARQGEFAHVEIAGILGLTEVTARSMIGLGCDLRWRLHRVSAEFAAGRIDRTKAYAVSAALANVSEDKLAEIERRLLDGAGRCSTTVLKQRARRLIARLDPEGARERRKWAVADRDVWVTADEDGTATVEGRVTAEGGRVLAMRLRSMALQVCAHDPRTPGQRRADSLVALAAGHERLDCSCGRGDCTAGRRATAGHCGTPGSVGSPASVGSPGAPGSGDSAAVGAGAVTVLVGVNASTLLGLDDLPGYLSGHGPIDADLARELAADATWKQVLTLTDSDRRALTAALSATGAATTATETATAAATGTVSGGASGVAASAPSEPDPILGRGPILGIGRPLSATALTPQATTERTREHRRQRTYRPTAALAEIIRTRDGTCRFPNCTSPATSCDIDHTVAFDHEFPDRGGLTVETNLACLCRTHHRLKTAGYWAVRQIGGGRLEWTDPTGNRTITHPCGPFTDPDLQPEPDLRDSLDDELRALLTDRATIRKLAYSPAEADLRYLLDAHGPRRRRSRSRLPGTEPPEPKPVIDPDQPPPF